MELLFDTANLEQIKTYDRYFPMTGVTTNPSIFKAEEMCIRDRNGHGP